MIPIDKNFVKAVQELEKSELYRIRVEECEKIKVHSIDKPTEDMLKKYQPSEPDWAIEYKTQNWRAITKTHFEKVESVIAKIFRASDFVVRFEDLGSAANGESLQDYTETKYPLVGSLIYYIQKVWLRQYLVDPNGVTYVMPKNVIKPSNTYWEPFLKQVESKDVIHFDEDQLIIKLGRDSWYVIDKTSFIKVDKTKDSIEINEEFDHNLGYVPAIYNGGKLELSNGSLYYESVISGVVPYWSQALMEEADKNVAIKQHVHPEKAVFGEDKCKSCSGTGRYESLVGFEKKREMVPCQTCQGTGIATPMTSSFGVSVVRPTRGSELAPPDWAPIKYIQKDISPLEFLDKDIDKRIRQGYSAVCMEQLVDNTADKTESGIKKSYDWEQTNLFLYNIAVEICKLKMPWFYKVISDYRYGKIGQKWADDRIKKIQPQINVPQRFDIVGVHDLKDQIVDFKEKGVSPDIINELEKQLVAKEFAGDRDTVNYLTSVIELDPLRNYTVEDRALMQTSGHTTLEDTVISSNIQTLVQLAAMDKSFYSLPLDQKRKRIYALAKNQGYTKDSKVIPISEGGDGVDTPIDVEAEAKAKLKGTVGGVQGVLAIQDSVSRGITQYEAAVTLLYEIYGFDTETSKKILGNPKKIKIDAPAEQTTGDIRQASGTNG